MKKIIPVITMFACLLGACVNKQKDSQNLFRNNLDYFLQTQYSEIDTVRENNELSFIFYYKDSYPNEKVYVGKDTIEHLFGEFDDKGTMWSKEFIVYNSNGKIIDDKSQYVTLNEFNDSLYFELIGESGLEFEIRTYKVTPDSSQVAGVLQTYKAEKKALRLPLKNISGHPVAIIYRKRVVDKDSLVGCREMDFFIDKRIKEQTKAHLKLIDDVRLRK